MTAFSRHGCEATGALVFALLTGLSVLPGIHGAQAAGTAASPFSLLPARSSLVLPPLPVLPPPTAASFPAPRGAIHAPASALPLSAPVGLALPPIPVVFPVPPRLTTGYGRELFLGVKLSLTRRYPAMSAPCSLAARVVPWPSRFVPVRRSGTVPRRRPVARLAPAALTPSSGLINNAVLDDMIVTGAIEEESLSTVTSPDKDAYRLHGKLAWYIDSHPYTPRAGEVFSMLVNDPGQRHIPYADRVHKLIEWGDSYADGRYAKAIMSQAAMHAYQSAMHPLARQLADQAIERWPDISPKMLLLKAMIQISQRQYRDAEGILLPIKDAANADLASEAIFLLAWLCFQERRFDQAREHLTILQARYPNSSSAQSGARILEGLQQGAP